MYLETTLETVMLSSLVDNPYITQWRDYETSYEYLKQDLVKEDGTTILIKRFYVTEKGALTAYPEKYVLLNGKGPKDIILKEGKEQSAECYVVPGVNDANLKDFVNILNKERNLKDWEKCEKALAFLGPEQRGQNLGGKTRWRLAAEKAGVDISDDTLSRYNDAKLYDGETDNEHQLIDKIKGKVKRYDSKGNEQDPLPIKTAGDFVKSKKNKKKIHDAQPQKRFVINPEDYKDVEVDLALWQQDNKQPWLVEDDTMQLVMCSPHYLNQRKYTDEGVIYKPVKLHVYINELIFAFKQAHRKLRSNGVLCINIADSYKQGENYMVIMRLCIQLADKLGFHFLFKQVWHKDGGLYKGHEHSNPTYDYEEILYFSKTDEPYFNPIKYYDRQREIELGFFNGRRNPNATYTKAKWTVSPEFETFKQFISNKHFEEVIITATAGADSKKFREKHPGLDHPAVMPLVIPLYPILCYSKPGDIVMDPWLGTGTTLKVALALGRKARGCDLEQKFVDAAQIECQDIIDLFH